MAVKVVAKPHGMRQSREERRSQKGKRFTSLEWKPPTDSEMACLFRNFTLDDLFRVVRQLMLVIEKKAGELYGRREVQRIKKSVQARLSDPWAKYDDVIFEPAVKTRRERGAA